jgi:hypothetical protein
LFIVFWFNTILLVVRGIHEEVRLIDDACFRSGAAQLVVHYLVVAQANVMRASVGLMNGVRQIPFGNDEHELATWNRS